jgi:hypothetical protein
MPLRAKGLTVTPIGDYRSPQSLMTATHERYDVTNALCGEDVDLGQPRD